MVDVRSVMKKKVVRISADDTLWIVKEIMDLAHVRHLPVVHKGELVGVVSQRDLMRAGRVGIATWFGLLLGTAIKVAIAFAMVGAFVVALVVGR